MNSVRDLCATSAARRIIAAYSSVTRNPGLTVREVTVFAIGINVPGRAFQATNMLVHLTNTVYLDVPHLLLPNLRLTETAPRPSATDYLPETSCSPNPSLTSQINKYLKTIS